MSNEAVLSRLEAVTTRLESVAKKISKKVGGGGGDDDEDEVPQYVPDFQKLMSTELEDCLKKTELAGLQDLVPFIKSAYSNVFELVQRFPTCKKPQPNRLQEFLGGLQKAMEDADKCLIKKKMRNFGDECKAIKESLLLLVWVTLGPPGTTPFKHCESQVSAAEFNLNRSLKVAKEKKKQDLINWISAMKKLNNSQRDYVKEHFKTEIMWNPKGGELSMDAPAAKGGGQKEQKEEKEEKDAGAAMQSVMSSLNKGLAVSGGLKKVTKDMKTKNRKDKVGKVTMEEKKAKGRSKGAASCTRKGVRWVAENYSEGIVTIDQAKIQESVFITMGDNTTYDVQSKVKSIALDSSIKCRLFLNELISTLELVNCKSITVVCREKVPSIAIEKCDSVTVKLLRPAYECHPDIYTSNITAVNIQIPGKSINDQMIEHPVPEQFLAKINPGTGVFSIAPTSH